MGKRRRKRAGFWLKGICLILLVPVFITTLMQRMRLENLIYGKEGAQEVLNTIDSVEGMEREVREHQENKKDILSGQAETQSGDSKDEDEETEMKVLQIVAQEIGIDKSAETIKAQCVIARTNLYDAIQAGTKEPESMPPDQQQELWGENFDKNYQKLKSCVEATAGETLLYNRTYIYAAYHAISSGRTRSMSELYEDADMPYLVTAECHADTTAEGYLSVFYYEKEEYLEKCRTAYSDAELTEPGCGRVCDKNQSCGGNIRWRAVPPCIRASICLFYDYGNGRSCAHRGKGHGAWIWIKPEYSRGTCKRGIWLSGDPCLFL